MPKRKRKKLSKKVNLPPGTLIYTGEANENNQRMVVTTYNNDFLDSREINSVDEFFRDERPGVKWLDIIGLNNTKVVEEVGKLMNIHPLIQEDILSTNQSSKVEEYEDYLFVIAKAIFYNAEDELDTEHISIILKNNRLITFQEYDSDTFVHIHKRLKEGKSLRKNGADDLLYSLLDSLVDNYFVIMERIGEQIDSIEEALLEKPERDLLNKIYSVKRELIFIRHVLWPARNLVSSLARGEFQEIGEKSRVYFRDIYDHIIQMIDIVESYRDVCSGMLDTYLSSIGLKTNEVMKVLTIFSTIFIPLTFLAGVYGMNFKYFPELNWWFSYPAFWLVSGLITIFMIRYLKKKDWM